MEDRTPQNNEKSNGSLHPKVVGRATILLGLAVLLFSVLLIRILLYQTVSYSHYQEKVLAQMTTESSVNASRGNIYDKNGVLLATNVSTYRVFISPSSIASAQREREAEATVGELDGSEAQTAEGENAESEPLETQDAEVVVAEELASEETVTETETSKDEEVDDSALPYDRLIAKHLSSILDCSYEFVMKQTEYTKYLDRTIAREVNEETADRVRAFIAEYELEQMIYLESTYTRYYPYSTLASHVIGFTGSDGTGLYGLELYYDKELAGTDGRYVTARDAQGNEMPYSYKEYIEAENGYHINSTLDIFVQSSLEKELLSAYTESGGQNRAAGIVMEVDTGAVLGMAVCPSFDLNKPTVLDEQSLGKLLATGYEEDSESYNDMLLSLRFDMWKNKAVNDAYIPGSTFKVMTAAMSLEEDVVSLNETFSCPGYHVVLGQKIKCHKIQGHGSLTFVQGIQQSCNPWLMRLGQRLGEDTFYEYLRAFGYLEKTGIDLPGEGKSVVAKKDAFTELDLAIYAFGQNFNVTLIQQITAVSAVANGGYLVTPHMISSITDENGTVISTYDAAAKRQVVSEDVCKTVAEILEEGVSGNGGAKNAYVAGYRIAAKTGTSEKKERECPVCDSTGVPAYGDGGEVLKEEDKVQYTCSICKYTGDIDQFKESEDYVCSTVAFAPADDPKYAVIIIVDEPTKGSLYGSTVAAPFVGNVMKTILPYLGVEAVYTEEELQKQTVTIPSVVGWSVSSARKHCASLGITMDPNGEGVIKKQSPEAGTVVEKSAARLITYSDGNQGQDDLVTVPNLSGMTAKAANYVLTNAGLNIKISGTKNYLSGTGPEVVAQSVGAGEEVPRGTVIEVTLRYRDEADYIPIEE